MDRPLPINVPAERLAEFCRRNLVHRLAVFGSVLRDDFRPDSDIDVLVEFIPGAKVSLFDIGGMTMELRELFGREVDLRTPEDLSKYFRAAVQREAKLLYAA